MNDREGKTGHRLVANDFLKGESSLEKLNLKDKESIVRLLLDEPCEKK